MTLYQKCVKSPPNCQFEIDRSGGFFAYAVLNKLNQNAVTRLRSRWPGAGKGYSMKKQMNQVEKNVQKEQVVQQREDNGITELVFILDRSGSMSGLEEDTIGGFNGMIRKQNREDGVGRVLVSTVLFDDESEVLHDRVPLEEVKPLTEKEYYVGGCTALLDAVGFAIKHIANVHKYARDEDRPSKTMFVITTDGMENASREFSYNKLKKLIEKQKEQYHWEFLFLGANIDAADTAEKFGIDRKRARNFHNDAKGIATNYASIGRAVTDFCCMKASAKLDDNWAAEIEADYSSRS